MHGRPAVASHAAYMHGCVQRLAASSPTSRLDQARPLAMAEVKHKNIE